VQQGTPLSTNRTPSARRRGAADAHFRGFLFADLRGYTAFVERRGNEAGARLLRNYRALVRRVMARHEGAEIRTEGDSFFVVFPSATSAVRGGVALVAAARSGAGGDRAGGIRVGVGIHAGETVETTEGFVGAAINVAARVCSEAAAGEVVVTETVRELTGTMLSVTFEPMGRRRLKGVRQPVALYRVLDPERAHARPLLAPVALRGRARTVLGPVFVLGTALVLALAFVLRSGAGSPRPSGLGATPIGSSQSAPGAAAESPVATAGAPFLPALRTTAKIAIPSFPISVAVGRDAVWVAYFTAMNPAIGRPASSVARVDPRTNAVVATIAFDSGIYALVADGDDAWVALRDVNQVQRINGRTNEPDTPVRVSEPRDIAAGAGSIWVTVRSAPRAATEPEGRQTRLVRVDPKRNRIVATIDLGRVGQEVEVAADGVWVSGDAVWHVDPATNRVVDTFNVSSRLAADTGRLAVGAGSLWLVAGDETIIRLDPATGRVRARFPGPPGVRTVAFGEGSLWATGSGTSLIELLQIDPASNRPIAVAQLPYGGSSTDPLAGGPPGGGVTGFGSMWVCVPAAGELWRFQPRG
jgi:class 3 adenylate cyclase